MYYFVLPVMQFEISHDTAIVLAVARRCFTAYVARLTQACVLFLYCLCCRFDMSHVPFAHHGIMGTGTRDMAQPLNTSTTAGATPTGEHQCSAPELSKKKHVTFFWLQTIITNCYGSGLCVTYGTSFGTLQVVISNTQKNSNWDVLIQDIALAAQVAAATIMQQQYLMKCNL